MVRTLLSVVVFSLSFELAWGVCTFAKTLGVAPPSATRLALLYEDDPPRPVTLPCLAKCASDDDCLGFVLHYDTSSCYWYSEEKGTVGVEEERNEPHAAWFRKKCLRAVEHCKKLWASETVPGAVLVEHPRKSLQGVSKDECQRLCLSENEFDCRSARFRVKERGLGNCYLSSTDRHLLPTSYRVSSFYEEYLENQCANESKNDFCSYEEYENATLAHVDEMFVQRTKEECQSLCDNNSMYNCRGYSLVLSSVPNLFTCYLHSEDTKVHGPKILKPHRSAVYFEKARCLNVTVTCTDMYMTIKYTPELDFLGKIYMQGYSDSLECNTKGSGRQQIVLKMPLFRNQCGILQAKTNYNNRTLMSGVLVVQYNTFIQTQSDRLVRVGCIFGNHSKVLVATGLKISSSRPSIGSTVVNSSSIAPIIEMRVVDYQSQSEASDTQIGQELQMVIEIKPADGPFDIWAGHLVAMTEKGDESIFLLDDRGCPTNLNVFPAFTKIRTGEVNRLVANFQAFKFSSSPVVRFSVIVQFCPKVCPVVECVERNKRMVKENNTYLLDNVTPAKVEELPLEFVMVVRNPRINSDRFIYGEHGKILIAGYDFITNEVCIDYSLLVGLIVTWVLIQVILVISCAMIVRRYRKYYEQQLLQNSSDEMHQNFGFGIGSLDNRRVHWADNGSDLT